MLSILTQLRLFRVVLGPGDELGLPHHVLHGGRGDPSGLLAAELHVTVEGVITKLSPAELTGLVVVFWVALGGLFLPRTGLLSWGILLNVTLILPQLIDGIEDLFWFALNFLTNLEYKE